MAVSTKKQIRDNVLLTTNQDSTQIGSLVDDYINMTLNEINDPGWAFNNSYNHLWSWLRRKTTFATVVSTEDYIMERDVDRIGILRQLSTPIKLTQVPDELFFRYMPNPVESGSPLFYREWAVQGISTKLSSADTINILSSSSSDGSTFTVSITGYISGRLTTEVLTLNGTNSVSGSKTFDAREIYVSKSGWTTGDITVSRATGGTTLVIIGKDEITPRFKVLTLYPTPGSAITMYLEYYKRIKELVNDSDAPEFDGKWHYVVRLGALAKVFQQLGKTNDYIAAQSIYEKAVRAMVASDKTKPDLIETLGRRDNNIDSMEPIRSVEIVT